ncbi:MAG TPA: sigma-70 family RNA polymerase sigma factor [Fimbriimonadaceae bacterium]|nr:sigma-70 family RNA polymerase sigma factor [Fimbriimonadaceae bacterium]
MSRDALRLNLHVSAKNAHMEAVSERDSDETLVAKARNGEYRAFELLFERHRALVYRFVYQMAHRRDDAEDIVQEVFVRAYQNLHRYRDEAKFTTWLLRIATNLGTDRARMVQRRMNLEQKEAAGALSWMTVGETDNPIDNLEHEELKDVLRRALGALPDHHRNVIVMRDIEEMEYQDIAATLGCTIGGAKLRVLRARRALRDRVAPLLTEANLQ